MHYHVMLFKLTSPQELGSPGLRRAPSDGSNDADGDTQFKPTIFIAGLTVLLVFAAGWKLKEMVKKRMRPREGNPRTEFLTSEEEYGPRFWDVWVDRNSRKQETCLLKEVQVHCQSL